MKHRNFKRVLALLLAATMAIGTFAGCTQSGGEESSGTKAESSAAGESSAEAADTAEEAEPAIKATTVSFSKSGKYTTTVTSDKVDLSGITAEDVEISYVDISGVAIEEVQQSAATSDEEVIAATVKVKVDSVKANTNGGYDISFTDENAPLNPTNYYDISFTKLEETASAEVVYPEITLTPDVENVVSDATQAKVTLAIDGSTFEDGISEKDIYLDNAFSDMEIESVSSSDKNLTVQLKGSPVRNVAGAYQWGSVNVKPSGITDGYADVASKVNIQLATVSIDASTLKFENGKINADLKVYGVVDINILTKDNIRIDGAAVEAAEKTDDNTIKLTLAADGVSSVNDFADTVGGKKMTLDDYETTVAVSQASFYPVFDYVDEDGDNLKITLKLYANSGSFDKDLKVDAISFADDFKDAKAESVTVDSDTLATLIVSVPANGQTTETFRMNGTVPLAAGTLTNAWGNKTSAEVSNTRDYSGETLGRDVTLNKDTLLEIQKYTRGKNTIFGSILYWGGVAGQTYSIAKSILEATGIIDSEHVQVMKQLNEIEKKIDQVRLDIEEVRNDIAKVMTNVTKSRLDNYTDSINDLNSSIKNIDKLYIQARKEMARADEKYANIDWEKMTDEEAAAYNHDLINYILDRNNNVKDMNFYNFTDKTDTVLKNQFDHVANMLKKDDDNNPMRLYDEVCASSFNFDTQSYNFRLSQRVYAETVLTKVVSIFAVRYDVASDPEKANFDAIFESYQQAMATLEKLAPEGVAAEDVNAYPHKGKIDDSNIYISDIILAGKRTNDEEEVKKLLTDSGYTPLDTDLNKGTNGEKIYLGYKTTKNINEAIRDFAIYTGNLDTNSVNGRIYHLCSYIGDSAFVDSKGDLNCGTSYETYYHSRGRGSGVQKITSSGKAIWLYYTKDSADEKAITDISIDNKDEGSIVNFNDGAGSGEAIYLHFNSAASTATVGQIGYDPAYHPYCYVLGHKIMYSYSSGYKTYYWKGAIKKQDSSRIDWSDSQIKGFYDRMSKKTIEEELASAGIKAKYGLILKLRSVLKGENLWGSSTQRIRLWREPTGDIIALGGTKRVNDKVFAKFYIYTRKGYEKKKNETYDYFTYFTISD